MKRNLQQIGTRDETRERSALVRRPGDALTRRAVVAIEHGQMVLEVDVRALLDHLGPRAFTAKGRRAEVAYGCVRVTWNKTAAEPVEVTE